MPEADFGLAKIAVTVLCSIAQDLGHIEISKLRITKKMIQEQQNPIINSLRVFNVDPEIDIYTRNWKKEI